MKKRSLFKILTILVSLSLPTIVYAACFDDLSPMETGSARVHIDEAIEHSAGLIEGTKRIVLLNQEAAKAKGLPDLKKRIGEVEIHTKKMLGHAAETIKAINGALAASDITKEAKGHGEEALSRINEAINNIRQILNSTKAAAATSDYNRAIEQTIESIKSAEKAISLTEDGHFHIRKM